MICCWPFCRNIFSQTGSKRVSFLTACAIGFSTNTHFHIRVAIPPTLIRVRQIKLYLIGIQIILYIHDRRVICFYFYILICTSKMIVRTVSKASGIISSGYLCTGFCTSANRFHKIISTGKILFLVNDRIIYGICVPVCVDCKILLQRSNAVCCFFCIGRFSHIPACKCITGFGRVLTICDGDLTFVQSFFRRFIRATVRIIFNRICVSDIFHDDLCTSVCCDFLLFYRFCGKSILFCRIYCCGIAYFSGKGSGQQCICIGSRIGQICFFVSFIRNTLCHLISNGICLEGDRNRIFFRVFSIRSTKYISVYGKFRIVNFKSIACRDVFYGIAYFIIAAILLSKHTRLGMSGNGSVFI